MLDDVIATARSGGQTNITIVGHTDTWAGGLAELSVRRANVVVEALMQMGARRNAMHASGVVRRRSCGANRGQRQEARNRRTVNTLQP